MSGRCVALQGMSTRRPATRSPILAVLAGAVCPSRQISHPSRYSSTACGRTSANTSPPPADRPGSPHRTGPESSARACWAAADRLHRAGRAGGDRGPPDHHGIRRRALGRALPGKPEMERGPPGPHGIEPGPPVRPGVVYRPRARCRGLDYHVGRSTFRITADQPARTNLQLNLRPVAEAESYSSPVRSLLLVDHDRNLLLQLISRYCC